MTLKGKYLPSYLCVKHDIESIVSSAKMNKGFTIVKCRRRQPSCKWIVQFCRAVFENVFSLMIFLKQCNSAYSFQSHQSFFPTWAPRLCVPPRQGTALRQDSWKSPQEQCLVPALQWVPPSVFPPGRTLFPVEICCSECCWCPGAGNSFISLLSAPPGTRFPRAVPHRCPPSQRHLPLFRGNPVTLH